MNIICGHCFRDINKIGQDNMSITDTPMCETCFKKGKKSIEMTDECQVCKEEFPTSKMYEYRGFLFCEKHFSEGEKKVDYKRQQIQEINEHQTRVFKGLNMEKDNAIGKANNEILKRQVDIAKKESFIEKEYRKGKL